MNEAAIKTAVQLRGLTTEDVDAVASVHGRAFPRSAITRLGSETVCRYYRWQLTGPHECQPIGAFLEETLVGFCFGGIFRGALSGFLRRNRWFLVRRVLMRPHLLGSALFRERLRQGLRALRRLGRREPTERRPVRPARQKDVRSFGILSVAVDPHSQGLGVGRTLMAAAEAQAREGGFARMHLTVHPDNRQAIRFYERLGWEKEGADPWKGRMVKALT